ncbi:hypothetical protein E1A91_D03G038700v1 [Gossypium mustelinum]|uniref:Uncharacterized protein n=1 Tax=Gossypium mustelinum TaxID=34275 RepID=A0A5D2VID2_GOSMU|nr:hypothetical protein E1A91_D03G038700v1 [Gossypium mustelinum]
MKKSTFFFFSLAVLPIFSLQARSCGRKKQWGRRLEMTTMIGNDGKKQWGRRNCEN